MAWARYNELGAERQSVPHSYFLLQQQQGDPVPTLWQPQDGHGTARHSQLAFQRHSSNTKAFPSTSQLQEISATAIKKHLISQPAWGSGTEC